MPAAHRPGSASILNAVDEMPGLTSKDGRQSPLAARQEYPKSRAPQRISHHQAETAREQYSQTGTLGKEEGDVHRKKIICSRLDSWAKGEYHLKPMLQGPRALPRCVPKGESRGSHADFRSSRSSSHGFAERRGSLDGHLQDPRAEAPSNVCAQSRRRPASRPVG